MLISFSQYVEKFKAKDNLSYLNTLAHEWFENLIQSFVKLASHYPFPQWEIFNIKFQDNQWECVDSINSHWGQLFLRYRETASMPIELITQLDIYFHSITEKINYFFTHYFQQQPYYAGDNFVPFASISGVELFCRIRNSNGDIIFTTNSAHSFIGLSKTESDSVKQCLIATRKKGELSYLDKALKKIDQPTFLKLTDAKQPHAESIFFIQTGEELIKKLLSYGNTIQNSLASATIPASLLVGSRIEFIMSSSPCDKCTIYFQALRQALTDNQCYLPIVIFSQSPYNTNEKSNSIFAITHEGEYQLLPFNWSNHYSNRLTMQVRESLKDLPAGHASIIMLNIYGEALLPKLVEKPYIICSFFHSLLEFHGVDNEKIITPLFLDWLRFYFSEVLNALSYDFTTEISSLRSDDCYSEVSLPFIRQSYFALSSLEESQKWSRHAHKKNNALLFFTALFPKWGELIYHTLNDTPMLFPSKNTNSTIQKLKLKFFQPATALNKQDQIEVDDFNGGKSISGLYRPAANLYNRVDIVADALHYVRVNAKYKQTILNGILTHPRNSPLGEKNYLQSDEEMADTIFKVTKAIDIICYDEPSKSWRMDELESIFAAFQLGKFTDELQDLIHTIDAPTKVKDITVERLFSQQQAFRGYISLTDNLNQKEKEQGKENKQDNVFINKKAVRILGVNTFTNEDNTSTSASIVRIIDSNWKPFLSYLRENFAHELITHGHDFSVHVLSWNQLILDFKQNHNNGHSKKLAAIRQPILQCFVKELNCLTTNLDFNIDTHGGFTISLRGPNNLIQKWLGKFCSLPFIKRVHTTPEFMAENKHGLQTLVQYHFDKKIDRIGLFKIPKVDIAPLSEKHQQFNATI